MIWFFLLLVFLLVVAYLKVGIHLIISLYKRDKFLIKKYCLRLGLLLVLSGFVFEILPGSRLFWWPIKSIDSLIYTENLTGRSFVLPEPIYTLDTERTFNGDGSSIAIYSLKENFVQEFLYPDSLFFNEYPKKGSRDHWEIQNWTNTPIKLEHKEAFSFAKYADNYSKYNLDELINEEGNYYAFKYYLHTLPDMTTMFGNIDFYLICPKRKIFIEINVNT